MSRQSKARRDARRKKEPDRPIRRLGQPIQPHAQLADAQGAAVGGAGWRDGQWLTVVGGQVVARTDSAALTLAVLRHLVALREAAGQPVTLTFSPSLEAMATREAAALGLTLEEYLQQLEDERLSRDEAPPGAEPMAASTDADRLN
ncbi:hypothetical protein [Agrilutibacter solisilvae]|uniref:Uncharacterized protein n=1 Tax=Agrilutibacter solisilvae TaxID=2763317 RepID=A0A975ASV9_9GAMM|nr:hypothetical protein [Lysobacter solisilvae]QSX78668.1 hypothetical protein I8J32_001625 [Lysobacter solisilvae]